MLFKKWIAVVCTLVICGSLWAHFPVNISCDDKDGFISTKTCAVFPLQLGLFPDCQIFAGNTDIPGIALNLFCLHQKSACISFSFLDLLTTNYGIQCGPLLCGTNTNYGLSLGIFNMAGSNFGMQSGLVNVISNYGYGGSKYKGIQIGLINSGGSFQIGLLNHNQNAWLTWMPIINFSCKFD